MKIYFVIAILCFIRLTSPGQYVFKIKADSLLLTSESNNIEFNLENSTKNLKGFLYNKGNGRTEFKRGVITINDSTFLIGSDTLRIHTGSKSSYIFSSGLTKSSDTVKNNLAIGISGGQSVIGGTGAGDSLILSSTSNASKGKLLFGASVYDEANNRLGILQPAPTSALHINSNQNSVTQSDANGILLANSAPSTAVAQSISPPITWQGNGWQTGNSTSQDVRFRADVLPQQGAVNPSASWQLSSSINGSAYTNRFSVHSGGNVTITSSLSVSAQTALASQLILGTGTSSTQSYRTTSTGSNITPKLVSNLNTLTAGTLSFAYDNSNQLSFLASNGGKFIARAGIGITNLNNTSGAEAGDLAFLTQSGGTAMSEKLKITGDGAVGINQTSPDASAILDIVSTSKGVIPPRMTTTQKNAIASPAEGLMVYDLTLHKLYVFDGSVWRSAW